METKPTSKAIQYGIIAGLIGLIIGFLNYFMGDAALKNWVLAILWGLGSFLIIMAVLITLMSMAAKYKRKQQGFLTFGQGFKEAFIVGLISAIVGLLFNLLLLNVVDPGYGERMGDSIKEFTVEMMEKQGASDAMIEKQVAKIEKKDQFSMKSQLKQSLIGLIISAVLAAIIAAILKRKEEILIDHG